MDPTKKPRPGTRLFYWPTTGRYYEVKISSRRVHRSGEDGRRLEPIVPDLNMFLQLPGLIEIFPEDIRLPEGL